MLLACVVVFCCLSTVLFLLHLQNGHRCSSPVVCLKWDFLWDISTGLWRQQVPFGVLEFFWCRKRFSLYSSECIDYCCFWNVSNKESLFCCCIFGFFSLTFWKLSSCFLFLLWRVWSRHCSFVLKKVPPLTARGSPSTTSDVHILFWEPLLTIKNRLSCLISEGLRLSDHFYLKSRSSLFHGSFFALPCRCSRWPGLPDHWSTGQLDVGAPADWGGSGSWHPEAWGCTRNSISRWTRDGAVPWASRESTHWKVTHIGKVHIVIMSLQFLW